MLLLTIVLIGASLGTTSLIIYGLYESSQEISCPQWAVVLVFTIKVIDFFQTLLLEQTNNSTTTFGKNLEMRNCS